MANLYSYSHRRGFLKEAAITAAGLTIPAVWGAHGAFAEALALTPRQTEGPFYPNHLPLDTDNDLIVVKDALTPAIGEVTHLMGRVLDAKGNPLRNVVVEIWQVDAHGVYLHTSDRFGQREGNRDANFQGFGRFLTASTGDYYFRTVKPVPYPGRTPHIHFKLKRPGNRDFTTQCYIKGHPQNERDGVYRGIHNAQARESVTIDFAALPDSKLGELIARFDIVLGVTPGDS